jgi:hypothetical protein
MVEDDTSHQDQFRSAGCATRLRKLVPALKPCKRGVITTVNDLKSQHAIEGDATCCGWRA